MTRSPAAVERVWIAVSPEGIEHCVTLRVGIAQQQPRGEWVSKVSLEPIDSHTYTSVGGDSWQAVQLGMGLIEGIVRRLHSDGWRFFWERGGDEAPPSDLKSIA